MRTIRSLGRLSLLLATVLCLAACGEDASPAAPGPVDANDIVDGQDPDIPDGTPPLDIPDVPDVSGIEWPPCDDPTADSLPPGCPCTDNADCDMGWCVYGPEGTKMCTDTCITECPEGWNCTPVDTGSPDLVFICVPRFTDLCKPCATADECGFADAKCVDYGEGGRFCGVACNLDEDCPTDYGCNAGQCQRTNGECTCSQKSIDEVATTACNVVNEFGTCTGDRRCDPGGLTECSAQTPAEEICDGVDNDCNGSADEELVAPAADLTGGPCAESVKVCNGSVGWVEPDYTALADYEATETLCDNIDNDCDGTMDNLASAPAADMTAGVCDGLVKICDGANGWNEPDYSATAGFETVEATCDGLDNDCDGAVDEDLTPGSATLTDGICTGMLKWCDNANGWQDPDYSVIPQFEADEATCDTVDNDCDGDVDESHDLANDVNNCGACNAACAYDQGVPLCNNATCSLDSCMAEYGNCDGNDANGCEAAFMTDGSHCGGCDNPCTNANGSTVCAAGQCVPACGNGFADCDGDPNNGCETSTTTLTDCNACGEVCGFSHASADCSTSTCTLVSCDADFANCDSIESNGCEIQISNDTSNCGQCGTVCTNANGSTACASGVCTPTCDSGYDNCNANANDGCETSTKTLTDCGTCGEPCAFANATASCDTGSCALTQCDVGYANCDGNDANGCEVDLTTDANHCSSCSTVCSNANGTAVCAGSVCINGCDSGYADCDSNANNGCETSTKTLTDCGSCGQACGFANASASCSTGSCILTGCNAGYGNCDGIPANGCEINFNTDSAHCGSCGTGCSNDHGSTVCSGGTCAPTCSNGFDNCNGNPNDGCETNTKTLTNCGGCGTPCSFPNASASCSTGTCTMGSCNAGFANCDGNASNGCEVNLNTDSNNCGGCNDKCTNNQGSTSCQGGQCVPGCASGYADCDGNASNGCETSTKTLTDCGSCGTPCGFDHASASCATGTCTLTSCDNGYGNCDGLQNNGCETNTNTTTSHCGGCGQGCSNAHGSTTCSGGSCSPSCSGLWASCDGNANNGCETAINTLANCSSCGQGCNIPNATESCGGGVCLLVSCNTGYSNCDNQQANGCEVNIFTSTSNCGSCNTLCTNGHGTTGCASGLCAPSCSSGWSDCDGNANNGCETNIKTNSNCNGCGVSCSLNHASQSCSSGSCVLTSCNNNYGNCDGIESNGCEALLVGNVNHCLACGNQCQFNHATPACTSSGCHIQSCYKNYVDLNNIEADGCECHITNSNDLPDDNFVDSNCDGIDGDVNNAIFVSPNGNDGSSGSKSSPVKTITKGITLANSAGKDVYVAAGTYAYTTTITLKNGVSIYGGYNKTNWTRNDSNTVTINVSHRVAMSGTSLSAPTVLDRLKITGGNGTSGSKSAYGVKASSSNGLTITNCEIQSGNGYSGSNGSSNSGTAKNGGSGSKGGAGCEDSGGFCASCGQPKGGNGGTNSSCTGANGGKGGNAGKGSGTGATGSSSSGGTAGGAGVPKGKGNWNPTSSHLGKNGANGTPGTYGSGCTHKYDSSGYIPTNATNGTAGGYGKGGGGGGGGGGGTSDCTS